MSSATSIEESRGGDPGLTPWQFFLLAGMLSATGVVLIVAGQSPASIIVLSLTIVAASFVAIGAYRAFAPLVLPDHEAAPQVVVGRTRALLEREKTLVLRSIKELEFDFAMKKIGKADFDDMSARLRARAIGLMRQLDEGPGYRAEIERELRTRLGIAPEGQGFSPGDPKQRPGDPKQSPGDQQHHRRDGRNDASGKVEVEGPAFRACACGTSNDPDARFCKNCGTKLTEGTDSSAVGRSATVEGVEEVGK
jgi:zinc ribbon protein